MNFKKSALILIILSHLGFLLLAEPPYFKLEKVAVSKLPDDIVIPMLGSVTVDPKGNVFAFAGRPSGGECSIIKFDENLNYLKRFGRNGRGPGEFTTVVSDIDNRISIDTNADVYVTDHNPSRFVVFDNDGNYKKDMPLARDYPAALCRVVDIKCVANGRYIGVKINLDLTSVGLLFTLNPLQIKTQYPFTQKVIRCNEYSQFIHWYAGHERYIDIDSQYIVFGYSQNYKFKVYDIDGNLKLEVYDKTRKMREFSSREMDYIKRKEFTPGPEFSNLQNKYLTELTANKSAFHQLLNNIEESKNIIRDIKISGDRVYVFLVGDDITIENKIPVDVYDLKGKLVKKGFFPKMPLRIWKNYAFFEDSNEEEDPLIVKYKILDRY